jgi:cell division protease FtsH
MVLGEASTGAANDLAGATDLALRMVREFGMSERLGPIGFGGGSPMYLGGDDFRQRPYAEATQRVIDEEVSSFLREAEERARSLLGAHRDAIDRLVDDLLKHETVDGDAVKAALAGTGPATGPADSGGPMPRVQYQTLGGGVANGSPPATSPDGGPGA